MKSKKSVLLLLWIVCLSIAPAPLYANGAADDLGKANEFVTQAMDAVNNGEMETAETQFKSFNSMWYDIEDGIKEQSKQAYRDIEDAMGMVQFAFAQSPVDPDKVLKGLHSLEEINQKFILGKYPADSLSDESSDKGSVTSLVDLLNLSLQKIKTNDIDGAVQAIENFRNQWLEIEGIVLTQSATVYNDAERDMVTSYALLSSSPPRVSEAESTIRAMRNYLTPLAEKTSYTLLDSTTILLREGLEALLVITALMGFLKKSGHQDKNKWIWYGVGVGIVCSLILGIIVQLLFSAGAFGSNNFLIMGLTGLFAAFMLLYMSYWLHNKSSLHAWQQYIQTKSTQALATGSLWSLTVLSFLAVFREGTETVVFFIGMAPSIKMTTLIAGIALGMLILIVVAFLILKIGKRIPVRPFFLVSSILVFYLCFKFTGMGIHGLQLAGLLPATHSSNLPQFDFLAIYQTWESVIPQLLLLILAFGTVLWSRKKDRRLRGTITKNL